MLNNENELISSEDKKKIKEIISNPKENYKNLINRLEKILRKKLTKLKIDSEKYNFLLENANDFICIINRNFEFEYINSNLYYKRLDYKYSELIGKSVLDFIHPEDQKKIFKKLQKGFKEGKAIAEYRFKNKKGNWLWMEGRGSTFKDYEDNIKGIIVSKDITDQKEIEVQLNKSEKKYKSLIVNMFDVVMILDLRGRIKFVSPQIKPNFGYNKNDILGKKFFNFIHPDDLPNVINQFKKLLRKKTILSAEYRAQKKDGKYIWVKSKGKVANFGDEKSIIGTMRNIDEKKKALTKLEESEERYKEIAELLPDMIYETDKSGMITYLNSVGYEMMGYDEFDIKKGLSIIDLIDKKFKIKVTKNIQKLLKGNKINPHHYLMKRKNGSTFYARVHSKAIYKDDKIIGLRGTVSNINRMILAQKKIKESEKKLKKLNDLKSELLRRTSHELKTPLVSIKGFTNLLLELNVNNLDDKSISLINEIQKGCNRLENLIADILNTAKLESGKMKIKKEKINLSKLIENAADSLRAVAHSRNQTIKLKTSPLIMVRGEENKILEVLENLLLNAIKYTPSNGKIVIFSEKKQKHIIISIQDTGIGFTEDEKENLFKQFGKIERYGGGYDVNIDGSGLGLYIAKKIIELHGGEIWMESEGRNKGSTFSFSLPII